MDDTMENETFSERQRSDLAFILDTILPASDDGKMPAAGVAGVGEYIERSLKTSPELRPILVEGLQAAEDIARRHGAASLAAITPENRAAALEALQEVAAGMFAALSCPTYLGYYQMPAVLDALGVGAHPPHPRGYEMEPNDLSSLLEPVRKRAKLYRDV